ncbi:MAG TPA: isoprenylcysteine carboxylmethyltransferase family protein [Polyangiaceae bacterium]|jgi:protein-S-isoprenylcysteine O-methyltransferase Ste14
MSAPKITLGLWCIFLLVWLVAAPFSRKTVRREPWSSRLRYLAGGVVSALLLHPAIRIPGLGEPSSQEWLRTGHVPQVGPVIGAVSVGLTALGIAFAIWARFTLGKNWSGTVTVKENHTLVERGPYALVRHPIYTGLLLAFFGTFLSLGTHPVRLVLGVAALTFALRAKMATEERFMLDQFGEAYVDYRRRVRSLIPFVW